MTPRLAFLACVAATVLTASAVGAEAAGAGAGSAAAAFRTSRTAWGDPDLQGVWTNASITTLERQPGLPDKLNMTEDEARAAAKVMMRFLSQDSQATSPAAAAPQAGDNPGGYNAFWLDLGSSFAKVNGQYRTSWIVDPANGHVPYSAAAIADMRQMFSPQARATAFNDPERRSLGERCIVGYGSTGGPPMLNVLYNNNYEIVQSPGYVTILVEMNHDARVIRLNSRHEPANIRPWMGDSIGWWDGDTLVVETTNLNPGQKFTADVRHRLYLAPNSKVTERFTRISDKEILYQFSVDEPHAYTQVWRGEIPMRAVKGPIYEYACHEGNYALPGILSGAREEEKRKSASGVGGAE